MDQRQEFAQLTTVRGCLRRDVINLFIFILRIINGRD